jgi:Competence-damaged protein
MSNSDSFPPPSLKAIAQEVASLLRDRKESIAVAETAAGGLISAAILSTPGASQIYKGGLTVRLPTVPAILDADTYGRGIY